MKIRGKEYQISDQKIARLVFKSNIPKTAKKFSRNVIERKVATNRNI
jgi:hypothetical protein